jgi:mono/diheme cytochrome c family protein
MEKIISKVSKRNLKGFILIATITIANIIMFAFSPLQQNEEWIAPASAQKVANPITSNEQSIAAGKELYTKVCYDCHGKKGKGDGPKSGDLNKSPKDFTKEVIQKQSDGSLFWKVTEGRKPMPSFKTDLSPDQRWQIINYVRTLAIKK